MQTLEFEDLGKETKLIQTMRFETSQQRDMTMQYGVETGAKAGHKRVDALLKRLPLDVDRDRKSKFREESEIDEDDDM